MTTERIDIQIREDGSRVVSRNLNDMASSADDASSALDGVKSALAAVGAALALDKLMDWADTWNQAAGLIRNSTKNLEEAAAVQDELYRVAQRTRVEFGAVSELYSRAARAGGDLGASQEQLIKFTEGVGKALAVQGTSATQAAGALFQLGQALTGNKIQAQEYNSLIDNAPVILQTVAKHLEGTGGTIGGLTKLVKDGQVSNKEFFDAFLAGSADLDEQFAKSSALFSQGWTVMTNAAIKYLGELDKTLGVSKQFAAFSQWFADNIDMIAGALTGLAVTMGVVFSVSLVQKFMVAIRALWALMLANPFVAVAAAVAGLITYLYMMRDAIKLGVDETTTLGDLMRAAWGSIGPMIQSAADMAAQFFSWLTGASSGTFAELVNDLVGYEHESESMWLKVVRIVVKVFDMIGATVRGVMAGVQRVVMSVIAALMNNFEQLGNAIQGALSLDGDAIMAAVKSNMDGWKNAGSNIGDNFAAGFREQVELQDKFGLESVLDKWVEDAKRIGAERKAQADTGGIDLTTPLGGGGGVGGETDPDAAKKAARELERLQSQLDRLMGTIDPVKGAMMDLAEAQSTFNEAVAKGLISQSEADRYMQIMKENYADLLDPLGALNRELDEHAELLRMSAEQADIEGRLRRMTQDLQRDGIKLTAEETAALRAKLVVEQELDRIARARDTIESGSSKRQMRDASDTLEALSQIKDLTTGDEFNVLNSLLGGGLDQTQAAFDAQIEQFANYYAIIEQFRQQDVKNEEIASQAKRAIKQQEMDLYLQRTSDALGAAAGLMKSNSKEAFRIGQAAAIGQAIVNTYTAATAAYQSAAAIPYVGWILGPIAAAGAIAAGMAQVSAIRSQTMPAYRTGGTYTVGGMGGVDSQTVAFRATPGEQVSINTPAQANAMSNIENLLREDQQRGGRRGGLVQNLTIVQQGKPNNKTPEQEARATFKAGRKLIKTRA